MPMYPRRKQRRNRDFFPFRLSDLATKTHFLSGDTSAPRSTLSIASNNATCTRETRRPAPRWRQTVLFIDSPIRVSLLLPKLTLFPLIHPSEFNPGKNYALRYSCFGSEKFRWFCEWICAVGELGCGEKTIGKSIGRNGERGCKANEIDQRI